MATDLSAYAERIKDLGEPAARLLLAQLNERLNTLRHSTWSPYPWQTPPGDVEPMGTWLMLGGRGTGKTEGAARYMDRHVNGPPCDRRLRGGHRMAIVAPTLGDAVDACVNGPSGLATVNGSVRVKGGAGGSHVRWPNGAEARLFGAYSPEDVERLRAGGNRCLVWLEEAAAMRHLGPALEHTSLGLRVGPRPHYVASTTPKPRPEIVSLVNAPLTLLTRGRTADATHLAPAVREQYEQRYGGTRLGRQELEAELLTDVEGALWAWSSIHYQHIDPRLLSRVVVAIDPAVSAHADSDETGIIVAAAHRVDGVDRFHVLDDLSGRYTPDEWATTAVNAYWRHGADSIVAEANNGGDMVAAVLRQVPGAHPVRLVHASRGKRTRAEPVAVLYEQSRVTHEQPLPLLESQLTTFTGDDAGPATDDRLDALVWAVTDLSGRAVGPPRRLHT